MQILVKGDHVMENTPRFSASLSSEFLCRLISQLDDDTVRAIILHGSYARGEALPPYSDVDLVRIVREMPDRKEQKRFIWFDGYLISISSRPLSVYRESFATPERAIFVVPGIQEAHILLDKDGLFSVLQQEAKAFRWEPLQEAADAYASQLLMEQAEIVLKVLRSLSLSDVVALSDMVLDLLSATTEAIVVQRGILVRSGNTYFHQVQEELGQNSLWTHYHLRTAGIAMKMEAIPSMEERGIAALHLYQETSQLLQPHVLSEQWKVIDGVLRVIEHALSHEEVS